MSTKIFYFQFLSIQGEVEKKHAATECRRENRRRYADHRKCRRGRIHMLGKCEQFLSSAMRKHKWSVRIARLPAHKCQIIQPQVCDKRFRTNEEFHQHVKSINSSVHCVWSNRNKCITHGRSHDFNCAHCNQVFPDAELLVTHGVIHESVESNRSYGESIRDDRLWWAFEKQ